MPRPSIRSPRPLLMLAAGLVASAAAVASAQPRPQRLAPPPPPGPPSTSAPPQAPSGPAASSAPFTGCANVPVGGRIVWEFHGKNSHYLKWFTVGTLRTPCDPSVLASDRPSGPIVYSASYPGAPYNLTGSVGHLVSTIPQTNGAWNVTTTTTAPQLQANGLFLEPLPKSAIGADGRVKPGSQARATFEFAVTPRAGGTTTYWRLEASGTFAPRFDEVGTYDTVLRFCGLRPCG